MATGVQLRVPKLDRHKTGQARVRIKGRSFYCGMYGTPEAEEAYRRLIAEHLSTGAVPRRVVADEPISLNEAIVRFWKEHVAVAYWKRGKPTSEVSLFKSALGVVQELYGTMPVADFSPKHLRIARDTMVRSEEESGKGWSRQSVNSQVRRIKQAFCWFVEHELVPPSVWQALTAVRGLKQGRTTARENKKVKPVSYFAVRTTLRQLPPVLRDMIRFQLRTGCRPGEVCDLCPGDVRRDGEIWVYAPGSHKTEHHDRERKVFIGPKAMRVLAPYLVNRTPDAYCFSPAEAVSQRLAAKSARRKTPLSCGNRPGSNRKSKPKVTPGNGWNTNSYRNAVTRACKAAGVPPWKPNQLRHNTATTIRKRYGLEASQVVLGHSNARITEIYAERDFGKAREIAAANG